MKTLEYEAGDKTTLAPFIRARDSVPGTYWETAVFLLPLLIAGSVIFGRTAFELAAVTTGAALLAEIVGRRLLGGRPSIRDGHSFLTGLLLSLMLPPYLPLWMAALGGVIAVWIGKEFFGGLGQGQFHPAALAHVFLVASFPVMMHRYFSTHAPEEAVFPLLAEKHGLPPDYSLSDLITGLHPGAVGETCSFLIIAMGLLMVLRRRAYPEVPVVFLAVLSGGSYLLGRSADIDVLSGTTLLAAFFLIHDPSSTPHSRSGLRLFAACCAVSILVIRHFTVYPDGTAFAVLLCNILSPWIDQVTRPRGAKLYKKAGARG